MRNYCTLLLSLPLALAIHAAPLDSSRLVQDARAQIGVTTGYDGSYRNLAYPLGKVAMRAEKDGFILFRQHLSGCHSSPCNNVNRP